MIRKSALLGLATLSLVAISSPALAGSTIFSDSTFTDTDYTHTTYTGSAGFTTSVGQDVGLSLDPALVTRYEKTGSTSPSARFQSLNNTFVYDPSLEGAILSIDVAFDQRISLFHNTTAVNLAGASAQARLMAVQDGKLYLTARNVFTGLPFDAWYNVATTGFLASDFTLFDPGNPFAARPAINPDFASGSAITFGIETAHFGVLVNGGPSTGLVRSKMSLDNLRITLNTQDTGAVPEPATWALMIGGFGLAGAALRRSRRAAPALA